MELDVNLDLLAIPSLVTHALWWLNAGDPFQDNVGDADGRDDYARSVAHPVVVHEDGSGEEVEDSTANEAIHEASIFSDYRVLLELEEGGSETEEENKTTHYSGLDGDGKVLG